MYTKESAAKNVHNAFFTCSKMLPKGPRTRCVFLMKNIYDVCESYVYYTFCLKFGLLIPQFVQS